MQMPNTLPHNWKELDQVLLLHFVRQWSGASLITQTHVSVTAAKFYPHLVCCEVDVESHATLLEEFRVSQVPSVLLLRKGQVLASFSGLFPKPKLEAAIRELLPIGTWDLERLDNNEKQQ